MNIKLGMVIGVTLLVSTSLLAGLYSAQGGATSISISASGTAATGASVDLWSSGGPSWSPVEGTVGVIDNDLADDDGDGGGLATIKVPAAPAGTDYRITVYLTDPDQMVSSYSYLNMCTKVTKAVTTSNALAEDASAYVAADSLQDHDGSGSANAADCQFLNAEKGFVTFLVTANQGELVDSSGRTSSHASYGSADAYTFNVGIQSGSLFAKDVSGDVSPDFRIEVEQS